MLAPEIGQWITFTKDGVNWLYELVGYIPKRINTDHSFLVIEYENNKLFGCSVYFSHESFLEGIPENIEPFDPKIFTPSDEDIALLAIASIGDPSVERMKLDIETLKKG